MRRLYLSVGGGLALFFALSSTAQITMSPLSSWGGGDGWLSPGEGGYAYLTTGNTERGLTYGNGHVYLVSRANVGGNTVNIRVLDQSTGADLGTPLSTTGISGGTFPINMITVGGDGAIYVANLTTTSTNPVYKVYRWASEGSTPTLAYSGNAGVAGGRIGDSLAGIGSGSSTLLVAGYGNVPAVAGSSGYAIIDPTAGTATAVGFVGTPPNAGDFRLGITFTDASHVLGSQGSSLYRYSSYSGTSGTLLGSPAIPDPAGATADRLLAYSAINGVPVLAVQSIGDSHVSIYDVTNPGAPVWLVSGDNAVAPVANANGTGELAWGAMTDNGDGTTSQILYAMSSNQGIQAFTVTVPEPGSLALGLLGLALVGCWRKFKK